MRSLYWLRNDLRMQDNVVLAEFCKNAQDGVMAWCPTPSFLRADTLRRHFILASLLEIKAKVDNMGGKLIIFKNLMAEILPDFIIKNQINIVYFSSEPTTEERHEETLLQRIPGIKLFSEFQSSLIHLQDLGFELQDLPRIFTPFRKIVEVDLKVRAVCSAPSMLPQPFPLAKDVQNWDLKKELDPLRIHPNIIPGETAGLQRIQDYFFEADRLRTYKETRNGLMEWNDSSKLSAWLSVGAITARQIYTAIQQYESERCKNESTYWLTFELLWRDYFRFNAYKLQAGLFNQVSSYSLSHCDDARQLFNNWCHAKTGDDFVDANMVELNQTGWMSNRGRQNVASYLAKTAKVDWRWGAEYFESKLIDYDASSNWGNWAYLAGVGQDPRDRIFNTHLQAQRYDKQGHYRQYWLGKKR